MLPTKQVVTVHATGYIDIQIALCYIYYYHEILQKRDVGMIHKKLHEYKKTSSATAFLAALICGLIVHLFGMVTIFHNYDDVCVQPCGVGSTLTSGRWFLWLLEHLGLHTTWNFNLPWLNSLVSLLLLAMSAATLNSILQIKNKRFAALLSVAFVSFPSITSILFFKYTAPHYCLAIFMGLYAVWITERRRFGFLAAIVLISCTLGTYQAYFPLTVTVYLILLIKHALEQENSFATTVKKGFLYLGTLASGMVIYFIVLSCLLKITSEELVSYQGINNISHYPFMQIPVLLLKAAKDFLLFPLDNYCQLANIPILKLGYCALVFLSVFLIVYLAVKHKKKPLEIAVICLLCALLPISINLIVITTAEWIYTLMVLPFVLVIYLPLILWEIAEQKDPSSGMLKLLRKLLVVITAVMIFFNSYHANVNYVSLYYTNRQIENTMVLIMNQACLQPEYSVDKQWVFVGETNHEAFTQPVWGQYLLYGGNADAVYLLNDYSTNCWIPLYLGHNIQAVGELTTQAVAQLPEVQEMPAWPNYGAVKVVGDYVVVKFS